MERFVYFTTSQIGTFSRFCIQIFFEIERNERCKYTSKCLNVYLHEQKWIELVWNFIRKSYKKFKKPKEIEQSTLSKT